MARSTFQRFVAAAVALAALSGVARADADAQRPVRALLVIGGCCHDYAQQKDILAHGISARANVAWTVAYDPDKTTAHLNPIYDSPDWAKDFDVVVHDECSADVKDLQVIDRILAPHRQGLPAVVLHCGMHCYRSAGWPKAVTPWFEFTGLQTTAHGAQLPIAIRFVENASPITRGLADWTTTNEELYNNITGQLLDTARPVAIGRQPPTAVEGKPAPKEAIVAWTNLYQGKTRVFCTTIGHNNATVGDDRYLDLVARGLLWSVDKLDDAHLRAAKSAAQARARRRPLRDPQKKIVARGRRCLRIDRRASTIVIAPAEVARRGRVRRRN